MEFSKCYFKTYSISFILLTLLMWAGCCGKEPVDPGNTVDKVSIINNIGDELILKRYSDMLSHISALKTASSQFASNLTIYEVEALRTTFIDAYKSWQYVSVFEFGPAETKVLRTMLNTFPTDTDQIISNINDGTYNLELASNIDATGFPALDYLLYGTGDNDSDVLSYFSDSLQGQQRIQYLTDIISQMDGYLIEVNNGWLSTEGNYITTFKESQGTEAGSSLFLLVNNLNKDFEILKNGRIGIPLGKKTLDIPLPHKTEAYYSGKSLELAIENLKSLKELYSGISASGNDGQGLDDYIIGLENEGVISDLNASILSGFEGIQSKMELIPDPLSYQIETNPTDVNDLYILILQQLVRLKTEMPSAMGVLITYQDNDGD